jgi:hypothetical protein
MHLSRFQTRLRIAALSLLGAVLVHVALVACTHTTTFLDAERDANAQAFPGAATPCTQWEIKAFLASKYTETPMTYKNTDGTTGTIDVRLMDATKLPAGWEPFAGEAAYSVIARHCVQ